MLLSFNLILGNTVTVMSPDGTPVQVNNNVLQQAVAQGSAGMSKQIDSEIEIMYKWLLTRIVNIDKLHRTYLLNAFNHLIKLLIKVQELIVTFWDHLNCCVQFIFDAKNVGGLEHWIKTLFNFFRKYCYNYEPRRKTNRS